ncbi:ferritin-like domain-containing protein [Novosphingobium sp.]|uniref:ferritin-like domain-containing protein n=1 Tax=Novosphingobium sp. TaxID=1874826 RepID=UPI0038B6C0C5
MESNNSHLPTDSVAGGGGKEDVAVLNTLIATLLDSVDGYQKSAEHLESETYRSLFLERARERQTVVRKLQAAVAQLGGTPEDASSTLGTLHRVFVDLKAVVTGRDDKAIISEVERGEDYLKGKFEAAMNKADLSLSTRMAVDEAWMSVREGHDQMRNLKHGIQGR